MRWTALAVAGLLASCTPHTIRHNPPPPLNLPDLYSQPGPSGQMPERWWQSLGDPTLNNLVDKALAKSFQLRAAWARVRQARAMARQSGAGKWPKVDLSGRATRDKIRYDLGEPIGELRPTIDSFSLSAGASYEIGIFQAGHNMEEAALLDSAAARDSAEAIAMSLAAEVAEAWFDLVARRESRALLDEQLTLNRTQLELMELRFRQGIATALDVYQQRAVVLITQHQIASADATIALLGNRIAVLTGDPPRSAPPDSPDRLPTLTDLPALGVPADLLVRRPDVRSARRQVEAADYRVAVAVAERLPRLFVGGNVTMSSGSITDLIGTPLWGIFSSITAPIFDGGRGKAKVEQQRDVVDEKLMNFGQALVNAMAEVENALTSEKNQRALIDNIAQQVAVSQATHRQAVERYTEGLITYLPVLTALQSMQQNQLGLISAQRALLSHRIQLYRALGGTWTQELPVQKRSEVVQ